MYRERLINIFFLLLRVGLGLFFLYTGAIKITQIDKLQETILRFDILPIAFAWPVACLGVAVELVVGICLVCKKLYQGVTVLGLVMCSIFVALFIQGWMRGLSLSCNCLGSEKPVENYSTEVGLRLALLGLMALLVWDAFKRGKTYFTPKRLDFSKM